jgi:hypothetical protein
VIGNLVRLEGAGGQAVKLTGRGAAVLRQAQNREVAPARAERKARAALESQAG